MTSTGQELPAPPSTTAGRRTAMAEAALAIIARDGLRALTHRAVDRELDLPPGSTSYYLRTRRMLVESVVHRLADRTRSDVAAGAAAPSGSVEQASEALAGLLDRLALRADDHLVRWALVVDLTRDRELHHLLTDRSPVRAQMLTGAQDLLERLGVEEPADHAAGLVALLDGLLFDRLAGSGGCATSRSGDAGVLRAYLRGLPRAGRPAAP